MKLYVFSGKWDNGKTKTICLLSEYFKKAGYKVASFQCSKWFYDIGRYQGLEHFILPSKAFTSWDELAKWIPAGYDIGLLELCGYEYLEYPNLIYTTRRDLSFFEQKKVNELIPFGYHKPKNRETVIGFTKTPLGAKVGNSFHVTRDYKIRNIDSLVYIDIVGKWELPRIEDKALSVGTIPPEYFVIFPNLKQVSKEYFIENIADSELGIIGYDSTLSDQRLPDNRIICMYPPAVSAAKADSITPAESLFNESEYPEYFYNLCLGVPSIQHIGNMTIYNGATPAHVLELLGDLR